MNLGSLLERDVHVRRNDRLGEVKDQDPVEADRVGNALAWRPNERHQPRVTTDPKVVIRAAGKAGPPELECRRVDVRNLDTRRWTER